MILATINENWGDMVWAGAEKFDRFCKIMWWEKLRGGDILRPELILFCGGRNCEVVGILRPELI